MEIKRISTNATVYTFYNIESYFTNVFLIESESKFFLIDTFCGSECMAPILSLVNNNCNKEVIVINTHFHWDHVWGNCSFRDKNIISHERCRQLLDEQWDSQIKQNSQYIFGRVNKQLPNITFKDKMMFHNEGIELFHSPGHTADSISIFDHNEGILHVGDNLERPIVYVENSDVATYIKTLKNYLNYKPKNIVAGHSLDLTEQDIFDTIEYLQDLSCGKEIHFKTEYERKIHQQNFNFLKQV